jgi:hypothetical protein
MTRRWICNLVCIPFVVGSLSLAALFFPPAAVAEPESPFCSLPPDPSEPWLPVTPQPREALVPSPRPASDCQFYRPAWQRFLVATQPIGGVPAFLRYPSFSQIFKEASGGTNRSSSEQQRTLELFPRNMQRPNHSTPSQQELLDKNQAGLNGVQGGYLIDQHGRFVFYQIHVNPAFLQFLKNQHLDTEAGIRAINIDANPPSKEGTALQELTFLGSDDDIHAGVNTNIVEYKSAWMIVDAKTPPENYFVVSARAPHFVVKGGVLTQEKVNGVPRTDPVKVALLALHVVFTLPGHPEMIWSTFEHVHATRDGQMERDNAPAAPDNPSFLVNTPDKEISPYNFPLYKAHTLRSKANNSRPLSDIVQFWDENSQSFTKGETIQTSVFRPFPGSKTDGSPANPDHGEDSEVAQINDHATTMFKEARAKRLISAADERQNYRLVGAIWLDQPASGPTPSFVRKKRFAIDENQSTDDVVQTIAGEGRLGSTAMESFTEFDGGAPNCFSCHDTSDVSRGALLLLKPARLNVSHVLSKFMSERQPSPK